MEIIWIGLSTSSAILFLSLYIREKVRLQTAEIRSNAEKSKLESELNLVKNDNLNRQQVLNETRENLVHHFQSLAAQALETNNRQFLNLATPLLQKQSEFTQLDLKKREEAIESLVKPLADNLNQYQAQIQRLGLEYQRSLGGLESELKKVLETNFKVVEQTAALKDALKRPHVRGRWGEIQLRNCVELSGMSEFCDFNLQFVSEGGVETDRLIPDMVVKMPGGRVIVVDAKTPIDAFLTSLESSDEATKQLELIRHSTQVKEHIKKLSTKAYNQFVKGSADFTVLFLPNESFLYAALETQPDLMEFALQRKILIATPPMFVGLLKVIRFGWNEERLAKNAEEISIAGKELHKRLCDFVDTFLSIGESIDKAQNQFQQGLSRLQSRVLVQGKRLEALGAKSHKELPLAPELEMMEPIVESQDL